MQLIMENWRHYVQEAIIDAPSERLSDIFDDKGSLKPQVVAIVQDAIKKFNQWLAQEYSDLKVTEVFIVGAAVTYQFGKTSDIDTTFVIPGMNAEQRNVIDDWMEQNLIYPDWSVEGSQRPWQFKPLENNNNYVNADSAYDPLQDKWLKEPSLEKAKQQYGSHVSDPGSKENKAYKAVERSIQPTLQRLYRAIEQMPLDAPLGQSSLAEKLGEAGSVPDLMAHAYKIYQKIKDYRGSAYEEDPSNTGRISQNWGSGNIIYKFLDREGYTDIFSQIKKAIKSNFKIVDQAFLQDLKQKLSNVIGDEIGFKR